jgi:tetratricopeptide (TPR) repeat protein
MRGPAAGILAVSGSAAIASCEREPPVASGLGRWSAAVFIVAFLLRLISLVELRAMPLFSHLIVDSRAYDEWALRIAGGEWVRGRPFYQAPLYPYFLALLYATVGHHLFWVRLVQIVIGSLSCVLMLHGTARWFGRRAGIAAGLMMALYAPSVFFDPLIQKAVLDGFFSAALVLALAAACRRPTPVAWLGCGVLLGLFSLSRETMLPVAVLLALTLLVWRGLGVPRRRVTLAAALLLGAALPVLPVYLHNLHFGSVMAPTTYNPGTSFYIGNHAGADGRYLPLCGGRGDTQFEETDSVELAQMAEGRTLAPDEVSRHWMRRARADIAAAPGKWLRLVTVKAALALNRIEIIDTDDIYFNEQYSVVLRVLNAFWNFGLLLPLAAAGIVATRHEARRLVPLYVIVGAGLAGLVVFYVVARYRYPLALFLMPFAGALAEWAPHSRRETAALLGVAAMALGIAWLPATTKREQLATSNFNAAGAFEAQGELARALECYSLSLQYGRREPATFVNYGAALMEAGDLPDARRVLEEGADIAPHDARIQLTLANLALQDGRTTEALGHADGAIMRAGGLAEAYNTRGVALAALGRRTEAENAYMNAIILKPDYDLARANWLRLGEQMAGTSWTLRQINALTDPQTSQGAAHVRQMRETLLRDTKVRP